EAGEARDLAVGEAHALGAPEEAGADVGAGGGDLALGGDDAGELAGEPGIVAAARGEIFGGMAAPEGGGERPDAQVGRAGDEIEEALLAALLVPVRGLPGEVVAAVLQGADGLLQRGLEGAVD